VLQDLPFLQPIIGETIYFLDGLSGVVERVIISPNNRRVIAMLLLLNFSDPRLPVNSLTEGSAHLPVQRAHGNDPLFDEGIWVPSDR
jgi:hypothetical protein